MNTTPQRHLALISLVVDDYDRAIDHYTRVLGFELIADTPMSETKRWVVVKPGAGCHILLAKAATPEQQTRIGNQTGGRVFLFLHTDDFYRDHAAYQRNGIEFTGPPRQESYGTVAVFRDLYGNLWDLIEPSR